MKNEIRKAAEKIRARWKEKKVKVQSIILCVIWLVVIITMLRNWKAFGRGANGGSIKGIVQWFCLWIFGICGAMGWQFYCLFLRKPRKTRKIGISGMILLAIVMGTGMFWIMEWIYNESVK